MITTVNPVFVIAALALVFVGGRTFVGATRRIPSFGFLGLLFYTICSKQLSVIFLDTHSVFITESSTVSHPTFAWCRFLICNVSIVAVAGLVLAGFERTARQDPAKGCRLAGSENRNTALFVLFGVVGLQLVNIVITGKVALPGSGVDRYNYWSLAALSFLPALVGVLMTFVPFVAAILLFMGRTHGRNLVARSALLVLVLYYVILVLQGQRFNGLLIGSSLVFGVYAVYARAYGRALLRIRFVAGLAVGLTLLFVYALAVFAKRGLAEEFGGAGALLYRVLVLQGHSYWNADLVSRSSWPGTLGDLTRGLELTMDTVGSPTLVLSFIERGVNFAVSLPGTLVLIGGFWLAMLGSIIYGLAYGAVAALLAYCVRRGALLLAFPAAYVFQWVHGGYSGGGVDGMLDVKFAGFLGIVLLYFALHSRPFRVLVADTL